MGYLYSHWTKGKRVEILCGDCNDLLDSLALRSVDLVITSPPYYKQRTYASEGIGNEETVEEYLGELLVTFEKLIRVTKPTGNIVYNLGDKFLNGCLQLIPYQFALRVINDYKLRLVNDITWIKQNPTPHQFPRRLTVSKEPFFHFALSKNYHYDRDAFLPRKSKKSSKPTDKLGSKYRELIKSSELDLSQQKAANIALDNAICEVGNGTIHSFRMKIKGIHAPAYGGQEGGRKTRIERDGFTIIKISGKPMKRDIIESPVENLPGIGHPAIFPVKVIREFVRLLTPEGGMVLDPYLGSGSTMVASILEGRSCIGIDISKEYCKSAVERVIRVIEEQDHPKNMELGI